jgi:hypothetical protein
MRDLKKDPNQAPKQDQLNNTSTLEHAREFDDSLKKRRSAGRAGTVTSSPVSGTSALAFLATIDSDR